MIILFIMLLPTGSFFMKDYLTYIKFDDLSEEQYLEEVFAKIANKDKAFTLTPNLDFMRLAYKDVEFRKIINKADYSLIDGKPILWIAKWMKKKQFKYKISGSDISTTLVGIAAEKGYSIAIFGGKDGIALKAKEKLLEKYPNLNIVYADAPVFGYEKDDELCHKYIAELNACKADIYFLCTGCPKTEKFFYKYYDEFGPGFYLSVGATVDFWAGNIKRAPKWMSNHGLEWLYRLFNDFGRLFKRYWLDFWFLLKLFNICMFNKKHFTKMIERDKQNENTL